MFLVSDSCSMLIHVKPQLCALVLVCQEAQSTVGACLTSRFHALSASKLANSCIFRQKWFLEMCAPPLPSSWRGRGEWQNHGDWEARLQIKARRASHSAVRSVYSAGLLAKKVWSGTRFTAAGDDLKKVTMACGAKPIKSVFLTNELRD